MSLDVALRSVAFYVLSCSTCAKIKHRRRARTRAKRERAEKELLETEQPGVYQHPSPFNTNPFWTEEILMGPGPPKHSKGGSKTASQRALSPPPGLEGGQWSSRASNDAGSSLVDVPEILQVPEEGWNLKRYQREDEDLWGRDVFASGQKFIDALAKAGSSARRQVENRLNKAHPREQNPASYYLAKNPPVNDLHPPVVSSQPASLDEVKWMLQPPPPAKIMEGKERACRYPKGTSLCSSHQGQSESLKTSSSFEKPPDTKIQKDRPILYAVRTLSRPSADSRIGQNHDRNASSSTISSRGSGRRSKRKKRPPSILITADSDDSDYDMCKSVRLRSADMGEKLARPLLPTIASSSNQSPQLPAKGLEEQDRLAQRRRPVLQEI